MGLTIVVAVSNDYVIGGEGKLPWKLPTDLKYFKKITMGGTIVMGRKTFESIGKALPGRTNIVLTRDETYKADGVTVVNDIDDIPDGSYIVGGGEIYHLLFSKVDRMYMTRVDVDIDNIFATRLYGFYPDEWTVVNKIGDFENGGIKFNISMYTRK